MKSDRKRLTRVCECLIGVTAALGVSATLCFAAQTQVGTWPTTMDGAVHDILSNMSDDVKMQIRVSRRNSLVESHFGLMTGIRERYGLWNGNEQLILSACGHPCLPEDAAIKIIEALWDELQK